MAVTELGLFALIKSHFMSKKPLSLIRLLAQDHPSSLQLSCQMLNDLSYGLHLGASVELIQEVDASLSC